MDQDSRVEEPRACAHCGQVKAGLEPLYRSGPAGPDRSVPPDLVCQECLQATRRDMEVVDQEDEPIGDVQ